MHNLTFAAIMSTGLFLTALDGVDYVKEITTPPPVEGWAERLTPVYAGQSARIEWHIIKRTECPGVAGRVWRGENSFYMVEPYRQAALPMTDGEVIFRIQTQVPDLAPEGDLLLSIEGYYDCPDGREQYVLGPVELTVRVK